MSEKKDREVRLLFSIANAHALEMLNDDSLADLTPHEIFIGSCKLAAVEPEIINEAYPVANVDKNNVAFNMTHDTVMIMGDDEFAYNLSESLADDDNED